MSAPDPMQSDDALDDEAAAWLCERDEGFEPARALAFAAWRDRDPRHAAAVARVERAMALLDEMPMVREPLEARIASSNATFTSGRDRRIIRFSRRAWCTWLAAACVVGFVAWWAGPLRAPMDERYATDAGVQRRVELRDGSVVDLNTGSEVRVQFKASERRVTLTRGEAYFAVARDAVRPFVVTAGGVSVRAIGTAFNVRLASTEVAVLVTEGKVAVEHVAVPVFSGTREAAQPVQRPRTPPAVLTVNEHTVIPIAKAKSDTIMLVERITQDRTREVLAWQDRMTQFTDVPLHEMVQRFNRRNALQLVLADAELGARRIGGVVALDQPEAFVRLLEQEGDIAVEPRGKSEMVLRRVR